MRQPISKAVLAAALALLSTSIVTAQEPPAFCAEATELVVAGDLAGAAALLDGVGGEDRPWADHCLGRLELARDEVDAAIERFATAAAARPEISAFHRWLGEAYVEKIDAVNAFAKLALAKKAIAALEKAVELAPTDLDARDSLVGFYVNAPPIAGGSKEKAAAQVAELKELDPAKGNALQGRLHFNEGEWAEAEAAYLAALEADAENADYQYLIGFSQQQQERYDAAIASFERAIEIDPGAMSAYYQIGRTAVFAGDHVERGAECLETYLERPAKRGAPGHEHAWWRLGMLRELQGDKEAAGEAYREALAIDPKHEEAGKALSALGS